MKMKMTLALALMLGSSNLMLWAQAKYVTSWKNPEAQPANWKGKKVLALVRTLQTKARLAAEQAMVHELHLLGIDALQAMSLVPPEAEKNRELARKFLTEAGIAGVVVMQVIEVKEEILFGGGQTSSLTPSYATFYSAWETGWSAVPFGPAAASRKAMLVVETLIYSIDQDRLIWRGTSETTDPQRVDEIMRELMGATGKELRKAGLTGQ